MKRTTTFLLTIFLVLSCDSDKVKSAKNEHPYIAEDVIFFNKIDSIQIHGTLTYPKSKGPFSSVILIPGSGRTNRDGTENNNLRPLFEIADFLTKNGMAVLRCDKRGVGNSEGTLDLNTTLDDFVSDITSSIDYLTQRHEINKSNLGLIGHSYGGIIAAKVSTERPEVSFVVMLGSPGVKNGEIVFQQIEDISRSFGIPDTTIIKFQDIVSKTSQILNSEEDLNTKKFQIEVMYKNKIDHITDNEINALKHLGYNFSTNAQDYSIGLTTPFWYEFYVLDPKSILAKVTSPILSIIGEKDLQVDPEINQSAIEKAIISGNNNNYTILTPPGYNHLFQKTSTGSPDEYEKYNETISQQILDTIRTWILTQCNSKIKTL